MWEYMRDTVYRYASGATTRDGEAVYCVGAVGTLVAFWHYRRGADRELCPLDRITGVVQTTTDYLPTRYHLEQDQGDIDGILRHIRDHRP